MELVIGLVVLGLLIWGFGKLADLFENRSIVLWLVFSLAAGALMIMVLAAARQYR